RRRIAVEMAIDRVDRHLGGAESTMQPLAGERIEEPCGIADEEPIWAGPPRDPGADRCRALDRVADLRARPCHRVVVGRWNGGEHGAGDDRRSLRAEAGSPAPAGEHDPDVDAIHWDRREADVAAVEHDHSGIPDRTPARVDDVER